MSLNVGQSETLLERKKKETKGNRKVFAEKISEQNSFHVWSYMLLLVAVAGFDLSHPVTYFNTPRPSRAKGVFAFT